MSEPLQLTTLGEALIVMDPLSKGPLRHVGRFEKHLGGAEFNVAVGLSRLGHGVGRAGRDPEAPTGLYFKEWRALGQLRVHYYRMGSAASRMQIDNLDVQYLLSGQILHLTGITAALSESCHELIDRLISAANDRGVTVSFDVNVRRGLLDVRDPREVLGPLAARADLLFLSEDEAKLLFGGSDPGYVREARQDIRAATVVVHRAEGAFAVEDA